MLVVALTGALFAQQKRWSMRANGGLSSGGAAIGHRWLEGYYFSFDIGIPIVKGFELAPTFGYASMVPRYGIHAVWKDAESSFVSDGTKPPNEKRLTTLAENMSSISLLLHVKPFDFINNEIFKKHQIIIGGGISYVSYMGTRIDYKNTYGASSNIFENETSRSFRPFYGKVAYNYVLKDYILIGAVGSLQGIKKEEAQLMIGVQFGVRF
jgi:hypothetical protein